MYSRREFIETSGKGIVGAAITSMLIANMTGCSSKAAASDSGMWETVRLNDFTLNNGYIYVNNSTLGTTLRAVQERMTQVTRIFAEGCYLDRFVGEIIRAIPPILDSFVMLIQNITSRMSEIGNRIRGSLVAYPDRFELITPLDPSSSGSMTCFRIRGISSETVYQTLRDGYAIHCKHATEGFTADASGTVNGAVRLSPHYYVSEAELSKIIGALYEIAGIR